MEKYRNWLWLLLFGSLWGINELVTGEILYNVDAPGSSVILTAIALLILAMARGMLNKPGTSTVVGIVAVLFRFTNTAPSYCHLFGIFLLGVTFDVFSSILIKGKTKVSWRHSLTGITTAYSNNIVFALLMAYVIRYKYWVAEGFPKVAQHMYGSASLAALLSVLLVPLGFWAGLNSGAWAERRPYWSYAGTLLGTIAIWTIARLIS